MSDETLKQFSFPGIELFTPSQARTLGEVIQEVIGYQPQTVRDICEDRGIGWLPNGYPDTTSIRTIELQVKVAGCARVAMETAKVLHASLTSDELATIVSETNLEYEKVPSCLFNFLLQRCNPSPNSR